MKIMDNEESEKEFFYLVSDKKELDEKIYGIRNMIQEYGVLEDGE